ncbi:glycosyltransferase family 39 protein [Rhizobium tropici]|nr:glycosyltransferase family 39 protein [Rhizobium tropici]
MFSHVTALRGTAAYEETRCPVPQAIVSRPSVSIILPTLNESDNIGRMLTDVIDSVYDHLNFEIIVTDGGSTDGTCAKVREWQDTHPVRLLQNAGAGDLASDVLSAARMAEHSIIVVIDADSSHPASSIKELVDKVASGQYDMAIGSRYVQWGATVGWPLRRKALSRLGAALAAPFTDVKDPLSGFFAIQRHRLLEAGASAEGFKIGLEALFAGGDTLKVCEIPITFTERQTGKSKIGRSQFLSYLNQLMRFARGAHSLSAMPRFSLVGALGFLLDLLVVACAQTLGADIMVAHLSGFCIATACNYFGHAYFSFQGRAKSRNQIWRHAVVAILALALRGGTIATGSDLGLPMLAVVSAGITCGGIVSYIGTNFYVFRRDGLQPAKTGWKMATIALVCYVMLLRIAYIGDVDVLPQEAYYWNYSQHPAWGYLDHPPMVAWLIWIGTTVFGDNEFGVRIGATLCWAITAYFIFRLTDGLFGQMAAFLSILLLSTLPFFFAIGSVTTPDAPLTAAWAGALYFLVRAVFYNRAMAWLGVGICIGLGMLSKYTIALLAPATLVFLLLHPASRKWLTSCWPYLGAVVAAVLFAPVIGWNATHEWASFEFQGSARWSFADTVFSTHTLLLFIAILLGPLGLLLLGKAIQRFRRTHDQATTHGQEIFAAVFTFVPLIVFIFFSLFHSVKLNWTGPVWLAMVPVMAKVVDTAISTGAMPRFLTAVKTLMICNVLFFAALLHYVALGLPFVGYGNGIRGLPVAWEEFTSAAEEIKARVVAQTRSRPVLVGMDKYNIASELAFYSKGRTSLDDITSQNLFGGLGLMFKFWRKEPVADGSTVIMYGFKEDSLPADWLSDWFDSLGPLTSRTVYKDDAPAGQFYYRVGYGFRDGGGALSDQNNASSGNIGTAGRQNRP